MAVQVLKDKCKGCTKCVKSCPFEAITMEGRLAVIGTACTGCGYRNSLYWLRSVRGGLSVRRD